MVMRIYCDVCDGEIDGDLTRPGLDTGGVTRGRFSGYKENKTHRLLFEIMIGRQISETQLNWNAGDYCKYCIIDAVNKYDDRPMKIKS